MRKSSCHWISSADNNPNRQDKVENASELDRSSENHEDLPNQRHSAVPCVLSAHMCQLTLLSKRSVCANERLIRRTGAKGGTEFRRAPTLRPGTGKSAITRARSLATGGLQCSRIFPRDLD